jgi:hypothetical protein
LDQHITEFCISDGLVWILYPFFDGFFGYHIIDGDIFPCFTQKIEIFHSFEEIIIIHHLIVEIYIIILLYILQECPELVVDALFIVSELFFGEKIPFVASPAGISDHACRSSYKEIAFVAIFHQMHGCHHRKHIPYL